MTPRSIRRAAERKQQKLLKKQNRAVAIAPQPDAQSTSEFIQTRERSEELISPAQLAANRANAQLSTGPTTSEGKAKSSLNAVKTGLTGRTVLLPSDDAAAYQEQVYEFQQEYRPVGLRESTLVQSIADTFWRLDRIRSLEMAIYAQGRTQFAADFEHEDPAARPRLIDLHTFLTYEKQIHNLQIQEARLLRYYSKAAAELRQLQTERKTREINELEAASTLYTAAKRDNRPFDLSENGFDFSAADIERYLAGTATIRNARTAQNRSSADPESIPSAA